MLSDGCPPLQVVLSLLVQRAKASPGKPSQDSLQLPPRLLNLARKSQGRKPGGLGVLGLKQRVSSRSLAQLAFPLMNPQHCIQEVDEDVDDDESLLGTSCKSDPLSSPPGSARLSRLSSTSLLPRGAR